MGRGARAGSLVGCARYPPPAWTRFCIGASGPRPYQYTACHLGIILCFRVALCCQAPCGHVLWSKGGLAVCGRGWTGMGPSLHQVLLRAKDVFRGTGCHGRYIADCTRLCNIYYITFQVVWAHAVPSFLHSARSTGHVCRSGGVSIFPCLGQTHAPSAS